MIQRSLRELSAFSKLDATSEVHERVYPTNACAGPALHDSIMDAPLGTMTDSVWHPWARARSASRSIFHVFQQHGFRTRVFGAFGLDARLDPHSHMHVDPALLSRSLEAYGVHECDMQDAAFTCQLAFAHDREVLDRVVSYMQDETRPRDTMTLVNLLGCQDAHKCTFHDVDPAKVAIPVMHFERDAYDERLFSSNVVDDDPRRVDSASRKIEALRRAAQLKDWIRGVSSTDLAREDLVRTVTGLHRFCWKCIEQLDAALERILMALQQTDRLHDAVIYLYSDHAVSLYEHGELCEAPWESCTRSFLLRRAPSVHRRHSSHPLSLAALPTMLLQDCGLHADWHVTPNPGGVCLTLGIALSWLARAAVQPSTSAYDLRTFFVRGIVTHHARVYGVIMWFSLRDMASATGLVDDGLDDISRARLYQRSSRWVNPLPNASFAILAARGALQVYDHCLDPCELDNMALHRDWCDSPCALGLKGLINSALQHHGWQTFSLRIPENVHDLGPDRVTFCSVQLHHRVRERIQDRTSRQQRVCHAATQTECDDLSFGQALRRTFGNELGELIALQLPRGHDGGDTTVFAPEDTIGQSTWPQWAPLPLRGAYTRDGLLQTAERRLSVRDLQDDAISLCVDESGDGIVMGDALVVLRSSVHIVHACGVAIAYRVQRRLSLEQQPANDVVGDVLTASSSTVPLLGEAEEGYFDETQSDDRDDRSSLSRRPTGHHSRTSLRHHRLAKTKPTANAANVAGTTTRGKARAVELNHNLRPR